MRPLIGRVLGARRFFSLAFVLAGVACAGDGSGPAGPDPDADLTITTSMLPEGEEHISYSATLQANRVEGVVWSLGQGDLPPGLQLSGAGAVTGTPERRGSWTFLVLAVDALKADSVTRPVTIEIAPAPVVLTTSLAKGVLGKSYLDTLSASGGRVPFAWSVVEGTLPPGLSLDPDRGLITGTPSEAGIWEMVVRVTTGVSNASTRLQIGVCPSEGSGSEWQGIQPWRTHRRDERRWAYMPVHLNACAFTLAWTLDVGGRENMEAQVVSENGIAALTSNPLSRVIALDLETGEELWHVSGHSLVFGQPAIYGGRIFAHDGGHSSSRFRAFDASSGSVQFEAPLENQLTRYVAPVLTGDVVVSGGTLYGGIVGMSANNGAFLWSHPTGTEMQGNWAPAVVEQSIVVVTRSSSAVRRLDPHTGEVLSQIAEGCSCSAGATPIVTSNGSVIVKLDGRLARLNPESNTTEWTVDPGPDPLASNGTQVFGRLGSNLQVIDEVNGNLIRSWEPPHGALGTGTRAALTDNILFLSYSEEVHAIDLETWTEVWHYPDRGSLSVSEGMLFIRSDTDGTVYAIDLR